MCLRWIEDHRVALLLIKSTGTLSHSEHQLAQLRLWHIGSRSGFRKAGAPPWSILACSASEHVMYQNKSTPQNLGCSGHTASCKRLFKQSSLCVILKHHPTKRTFTCNRPKGSAATGRPAPSEMLAWRPLDEARRGIWVCFVEATLLQAGFELRGGQYTILRGPPILTRTHSCEATSNRKQ